MTSGKAGWQCVTPGCGKARYRGEYCDSCSRRDLKRQRAAGTSQPAGSGAFIREPKREVRAVVYPTGAMRWGEAQREQEMTDGKQRWWVIAQERIAA